MRNIPSRRFGKQKWVEACPVKLALGECHTPSLMIMISVSAKFAGPQPQAGNRGGGLATEAFAGPAGLAVICENYIGFCCCNMQLTYRTYNLKDFAGPRAGMAFKVFADTDDMSTLVKGNGLVPLSNKPLPEPLSIQIYGVICSHHENHRTTDRRWQNTSDQ